MYNEGARILKLLIKRILSYFPTKLPVGMAEFNVWADSILELSGQYADRDSMTFAIASMLIHADSKVGSLSKNYFVVRLRKSAANQVASQVFQDIKAKQAELEAARKAAAEQPPVDTTAQETATSGQQEESKQLQ